MAQKLTLSGLRESAEQQFGRLDFEIAEGVVVKFLNPIQMDTDQRTEMRLANQALLEANERVSKIDDNKGKKGKGLEPTPAELAKIEQEQMDAMRAAVRRTVRAMLVNYDDMAVIEEAIGDEADLWTALMTNVYDALRGGEA